MLWDEDAPIRPLAPSEQRFVRHGTYTGRSVSVRGALEVTALGEAFAALRRAYPVIGCRIAEDDAGQGHLLEANERAWVPALVREGDVAAIGTPAVDPAVQLAYLDVVGAGAHEWRVTLFAHHSVADAGHCVELLARLWDCYTGLVEGRPTSIAPQGIPQSLEWHVAARGIAEAAVSGFEDVTKPLPPEERTVPPDSAQPAPSTLARPPRVRLDRAETARIVDLGRKTGVTVNGLLTAALLRAYARVAAGGATPLGCLYPVDLRTRLRPPVATAAGTNMAGMAAFAAEVDPEANVVELAQRVSARLTHDLAEGVVQQSVLHFPDYYGATRIHSLAGHVAVTNTGVVPAFRMPAGLEPTDYEIVYLSAHPRPSAGASAAVTYLAYTFAGELTVGVLGGGARTDDLRQEVRTELTALSAVRVN
ncbi:phthiocerol/phthiodiolone dimycocerosyl transferase family protein [Nocardia barduliensis]|uniref:phthiocerol/phthiodiolone dimycocerosyl transferase family protein n=1 Tax=Nocardia barduliensis TaxID=2736643 RepID=UPI001572AEF4|nr:acyltransferase [Nocardia barduliensis]